jgi:hypothetical protein
MFLKVLSKYFSFALTLANFTAISHAESGELNLNYPDLPKPITSFGAVKLENFFFLYIRRPFWQSAFLLSGHHIE